MDVNCIGDLSYCVEDHLDCHQNQQSGFQLGFESKCLLESLWPSPILEVLYVHVVVDEAHLDLPRLVNNGFVDVLRNFIFEIHVLDLRFIVFKDFADLCLVLNHESRRSLVIPTVFLDTFPNILDARDNRSFFLFTMADPLQ